MTSPDIILNHSTVTQITNPAADVEVITVQVPGVPGPQGVPGTPAPPNVLTIGSVSNTAPGDPADATITGSAPNQVLNLVLPQGIQGPQGVAGPPPTLSVGSTTTGAAGTSASVTIDGTAAPAYVLNFTIPQGANGGGVVVGGAVGDVLMKNSTTDYDTKWSTPTSASTPSTLMERDASGRASVADPSASTDIATKNYIDNTAGSTNNTASALVRRDASGWINAGRYIIATTPPTQTNEATRKDYVDVVKYPQLNQQAANYTLVLGDERKIIYCTSATAATVTVPTNATVAFPIGTVIEVIQGSTGTITIAGAGVTFWAPDNNAANLVTRGRNSLIRLTKTLTDTWEVSGDAPNSTVNTVNAATNVATAGALIQRDGSGRASVADPSASTDIATKNYIDNTAGTSSGTVNTLARRDSNGNANFNALFVGTQNTTVNAVTRKDYVDVVKYPQVNTQTVSYTLVLTDERKIVQMNSASATTLTVPPNSSVAFPIGTVLDVQMLGTGAVTISPGAGVTFDAASSILTLSRQYAVVTLQKIGTDTWNVLHAGVASATSASTANAFMIRDSAGRASVADPSASTDIATKNYTDTQLAANRRYGINTQTATYTLALTDEYKIVQMNSSSTTTVNIPLNSSVAFSIGAVVVVEMLGTGFVNLTPAAGATLSGQTGTLTMTRQNTIVKLTKIGTDAWVADGYSIAAATSSNTANTMVLRDGNSRAQFADPSAAQDAATKNYVDGKVPVKITVATTAPSSPAVNDLWVNTT